MFFTHELKELLHSYVCFPEKLCIEINKQSSFFSALSEQLKRDLETCVDLSYCVHLPLLSVQKKICTLYTYHHAVNMAQKKVFREYSPSQGKYPSSIGKYFLMCEAKQYLRKWLQKCKHSKKSASFQKYEGRKNIEKIQMEGENLLISLERFLKQNMGNTFPNIP